MATGWQDPGHAEIARYIAEFGAFLDHEVEERNALMLEFRRSPLWECLADFPMRDKPFVKHYLDMVEELWDSLSDAERYPRPSNVVPLRDEDERRWATEEDSDKPRLKATPFVWRAEAEIPQRQWLYGRHLLRKFLSVDVAAGGVGKSSLKIGEALSMAANRPLYGKEIHGGPLRVWLYNLEDPNEETERRIHATAKRFHIAPEDIGDRLFVDSGREQSLVIASDTPTGAKIMRPVVESLIAEMHARQIDVLIVDPFVSSHMVSENDNMAIDLVAKEWGRIADACNCSINLVHHIRKQNGTEATADSARGASSLIGAARSVQVYNRMTKEEADKAGIPPEQVKYHFRVDNDKSNLAPAERADWYRMNNVDLDNGDQVGVACSWQMPDTFEGISVRDTMEMQKLVGAGRWRENVQANDWVGIPISQACRLDPDEKKDQAKIKAMLKRWLREGVLEVVEEEDSTRRTRKYVVVGRWITE